MSIIIFVTVGTSAISNPDIGRAPRGERDNGPLRRRAQLYLDDPDKNEARSRPLLEELCAAHRAFWEQCEEYIRFRANATQTSAELRSTWLFTTERHMTPDEMVLLPSNTPESKLAAWANENVLRKVYPAANVAVEPIQELNDDMIERPDQVIPIIRRHCGGTDDRRWLNITGGYKGTVAILTLVAQRMGLQLFYQHEKKERPVWVDFRA
jgi:putative CRISPR-associated protein (TIGR02619 family)